MALESFIESFLNKMFSFNSYFLLIRPTLQNSLCAPIIIEPGSALINNFLILLFFINSEYSFTILITSDGSPSNGICLGQLKVGCLSEPALKKRFSVLRHFFFAQLSND